MVEKIGFAEYRNAYSFLWKNSTAQKSVSSGLGLLKKRLAGNHGGERSCFFFEMERARAHGGVLC